MRRLWSTVWNSEPVVFVGSLASAWGAVVALDQADDSWALPLVAYVVAVPVLAALTGIVRGKVSPVDPEG